MLQRLPSSRFGFIIVYRVYCVHALVPNLHQICTKHEEGEAACLLVFELIRDDLYFLDIDGNNPNFILRSRNLAILRIQQVKLS